MSAEKCKFSLRQVAKTIDHALLKPDLPRADVIAGCKLARDYDVASVCCKPCDISLCAKELEGSTVLVGTVVGFPHGNQHAAVKAFEAAQAVKDGATEIDLVINIGWLCSGDVDAVEAEVRGVVHAAEGHCVKVILECAYLTDEQIVQGCHIVDKAGAHYVKTSTGFAATGAKLEDVQLIVATVNGFERDLKVKSAGGIRTLEQLLAYMEAGVTRSGASATAAMLDEFKATYGTNE